MLIAGLNVSLLINCIMAEFRPNKIGCILQDMYDELWHNPELSPWLKMAMRTFINNCRMRGYKTLTESYREFEFKQGIIDVSDPDSDLNLFGNS